MKTTVAIALRNPDLRGLVRRDLESQGFQVVAETPGPLPRCDADVLVTEFLDPTRPLTVWVVDDDKREERRVVRLPRNQLSRLADVIRGRR